MKPARKQVDDSIFKVGPSRIASVDRPDAFYNIWYNKWSGGERTSKYSREKAKTRCKVELDAGETKGDKMPNAYFCLYFARGCCPFGHECNYWHRIPTESDPVDTTIDVFGRDKFDEYREDMGGVGSFNRENRTLYVGYIRIGPNMEEIVRRHFSEWGEIEKIKILKEKGVAFVTYQCILNAEFAKEAMSNQSLDHNEVLNVRWATDDPNPRAKAEYKRKAEAIAAQAIQKSLPAEFTLVNDDYLINKRPRVDDNFAQDQYGLEGYQTPWYLESSAHNDKHKGQNADISTLTKDMGSVSADHKKTIISAETLENIKSISQSIGKANTKTDIAQDNKNKALIELADYGSDEGESDEEE
ncbi:4881_t:CDS:2 [Acaulospora morrowiae]|uniref:4881_t:CDS:1 n=1 Tax=Acaulospora morrowiae TaxID=94023 RepID=A0A9N8YWZ1_9GLOM|nr:4881_t:CDS:2 [Acaulospora morrowiae]